MKNTSKNISRRGFLKSSALLGGTTVGLSLMGSEAFAALSEDEKNSLFMNFKNLKTQFTQAVYSVIMPVP